MPDNFKKYLKESEKYFASCKLIPDDEDLAKDICSQMEEETGLEPDYNKILKRVKRGK